MKRKRLVFKMPAIIRATLIQMAITGVLHCSMYANNTEARAILDIPVTISATNISISKVISIIEKQTGVNFIYSSNFVAASRKISCSAKETKLGLFIETFLKPIGIGYKIFNEQIILYAVSKNVETSDAVSVAAKYDEVKVPDGIVVSGTVSNDKGEPLEGATINVKQTKFSTISDSKGNFKIEVPDENSILVISYTGFTPFEVAVGKQTQLSIKMTAIDNKLNDVVVIGYGSQKQAKVTGSIASVTAKDFNGIAVTGLDQALQGQVSGVQVTQNSGEPGGSVSIRIRGVGSINQTNEPLYVIDGVPYGSLNSINPNDIERIDVLKDAAAASIYGSRASNGVVLVTTKHAKKRTDHKS